MACNKNEGMFFGTGLFESTSRRESRSFLFIYSVASQIALMVLGSLERGDCLCLRPKLQGGTDLKLRSD